MGSRASMRDDDIARAEFVVDSARQAVGDLMRKIEQVCTQSNCTLQFIEVFKSIWQCYNTLMRNQQRFPNAS